MVTIVSHTMSSASSTLQPWSPSLGGLRRLRIAGATPAAPAAAALVPVVRGIETRQSAAVRPGGRRLQPWSPSLGGLRPWSCSVSGVMARLAPLQPWSPSLGGLRLPGPLTRPCPTNKGAAALVPVVRGIETWSPGSGRNRSARDVLTTAVRSSAAAAGRRAARPGVC